MLVLCPNAGIAGLFSAGLLPKRLVVEPVLLKFPNESFGVSAVLPNSTGVVVVVVVLDDGAGLSEMLLKKEPSVEVG